MKAVLKNVAGLLILFILCLLACKKDILEIRQDKTYNQINAPRPATAGVNTGTSLTLTSNGKAKITLPGDIIYLGIYKVRGKKLIIKVADIKQEFIYTIISESRLEGINGQILVSKEYKM